MSDLNWGSCRRRRLKGGGTMVRLAGSASPSHLTMNPNCVHGQTKQVVEEVVH